MPQSRPCYIFPAYLDETDVLASLSEALTADVQAIFADETSAMRADAAVTPSVSEYLPNPDYTKPILPCRAIVVICVPFASALAVVARTRVPDRLVGHVCGR